jgi:putative ABC transport system substrate-binding protein
MDPALRTAIEGHAGALLLVDDRLFVGLRAEIAAFALKHRLPTIYGSTAAFAEAGGLAVYGPNDLDYYRHAASYVDRILKGAKPGDLPVEQPTRFELVINLRTAKVLGLTIPPSLLQRADQVIE